MNKLSVVYLISVLICIPPTTYCMDKDDAASLIYAARQGDISQAEKLLRPKKIINQALWDITKNRQVFPLLEAVENEHIAMVELLLTNQANPNQAKKPEGTTPLIAASKNGNSAIIALLLNSKAHVDQSQNDGTTALIKATIAAACAKEALDNHLDSIKQLLNGNADQTLINIKGKRAIDYAFSQDIKKVFEESDFYLQARAEQPPKQ